ncbi:MAG: hypothetical protein JXB60_07105 [Candidatus Cloacimonetes bacterium]|nr:hypothetical protein [Candidatus Cloacimonadota bacterium]
MKQDAHYYGVLAFSRAAGFKTDIAAQIAYASQHVDDARVNYIQFENDPEALDHTLIKGKPGFFGMSTCHCYLKVKTFNYSAMIYNTVAFHFVPGGKGSNFVKKMRCQEDNRVINLIMQDALQEDDPVILGVCLHPYADTFSHQGFSGLMSKVNDIKKIQLYSHYYKVLPFKLVILIQKVFRRNFDKHFDKFMPAYGHGQALSYPDLPFLKWSYEFDYTDEFSEDYRNTGLINNPERFQRCFDRIRTFLQDYLERHPQYRDNCLEFNDYELLFRALTARYGNIKRNKDWQKILVKLGLLPVDHPAITYNEFRWTQEAFADFSIKKYKQRMVEQARLHDNFCTSNWYRFYKAVKWYKERFFKYCSQEGIEINQ